MEEQLLNEVEEVQYLIEKSPKNDQYTISLSNSKQKQYVLSKYEPRKSAQAKLDINDLGNMSTNWIVFGFNFGYLVEEIINQVDPSVSILVIEPNEEVLQEELKINSKDNQYKEMKNVRFFSGTDFIKFTQIIDNLLGMTNFNNFKIMSNDVYLNFYKNYFQRILGIIDQCVENKIINFNTIILGNVEYIQNTIKNRYDIANTYDMSKLKNRFKDVPVVIVSAGPSLDKNINYLKDFNGLIFVIGRTLTPVLKLGIRPDFVFSLDPFPYVYETFGENKQYDIPLITLCQSNTDVVKGCKSQKYFLYNSAEVDGLLGLKVNPILDLSGSVATLCLSSAYYMGCSPIMFIGQDLAYDGEKMYAKDSNVSHEKVQSTNNPDLRVIKSYYGEKVYSSVVMISFLRWMEDFISKNSESQYINCTEGGAYMEGATHMPFKEAIKQYNPPKKVQVEHEKMTINDEVDVDKNLSEGIENLKKIQRLLEISTKDYSELVELYRNKPLDLKTINKHIKSIEASDKKIKEIKGSARLMDLLLERIKNAIATNNDSKQPINETKEELTKRKLRLNLETYGYLVKECRNFLSLIEENI